MAIQLPNSERYQPGIYIYIIDRYMINRGYSTSGQCILDLLNESCKNDKNEALAEFLSFLHDEFNKSNIHWPRVLYHIYNMTTERMVTTKVSEIIFNLSLIRPYWNGMFEVSTSVFQNQYRSTLPKVGPSPCRTIFNSLIQNGNLINFYLVPCPQNAKIWLITCRPISQSQRQWPASRKWSRSTFLKNTELPPSFLSI